MHSKSSPLRLQTCIFLWPGQKSLEINFRRPEINAAATAGNFATFARRCSVEAHVRHPAADPASTAASVESRLSSWNLPKPSCPWDFRPKRITAHMCVQNARSRLQASAHGMESESILSLCPAARSWMVRLSITRSPLPSPVGRSDHPPSGCKGIENSPAPEPPALCS